MNPQPILSHVPLVTAGFLLAFYLAYALYDALNLVAWLEVFGGEP